MATINGLATLNVEDVTSSDFLPVYDASAGTDKKLAAFESGTWVPALTFGGSSTGLTYTTRQGTYTRIGRIVLASCLVYLSNKGSSTGDAVIGNLPYLSISTSGAGWVGACYWRSMAANGYSVIATLGNSSTSIALNISTASANTAFATNANFGNSSIIMVTMMYEAVTT